MPGGLKWGSRKGVSAKPPQARRSKMTPLVSMALTLMECFRGQVKLWDPSVLNSLQWMDIVILSCHHGRG